MVTRNIKGSLFALSIALLLAIAAASLANPAATRAQPDLEAIFGEFQDALNAGDVDAALALVTDDATFEAGPMTFSGQAQLRKAFEMQVSQNRQVTIVSSEVSGDTVTAQLEVRSKQATACGVERVVGTQTATFSDDKISRLVFQDDPSDEQTATVLACTQAMGIPATGGPPSAPGSDANWWLFGLGLAAVSLGAATILVWRRRQA